MPTNPSWFSTGGSPTIITSCPVPYHILNRATDGLYTFDLNTTGRQETIAFSTTWEDRGAFINFVAGYSRYTGGAIVRNQPLTDPYCTYLYLIGLSGKGYGTDGAVSIARPYPRIRYTATFGTLPWDPNGSSPYYSVRYRGTTSTSTVPGAKLKFVMSEEEIDHDWGVLIGQYAIEITLYQVPDLQPFFATYDPLKGMVNSDVVTIRGYAYAAGTLLLNTLDASESVDSTGQIQNQCTISLIARGIPWNSDINSSAVVDTISPAPYQTTTMSGAFS